MPYNERDPRKFGLLCPLLGDLPYPGIKPVSLMSSELAGRFFTISATWEAPFSHFSSVQSLSRVRLFVTPWTAARQASLSITNSQSLFKLMSIESVMPSKHLILLSPYAPTFNLSQHQGLFKWVSSSHQVAKVLELQHQSLQWIFRTDFL